MPIKPNKISQSALCMKVLPIIFGHPLASLDPVVESTNFFISRNFCQNRSHLMFQLICIVDGDSCQPFFQVAEAIEVANREIRGIGRMQNSPAASVRHLVNDCMCCVAR
jgi:hypothetical protein